jgi:tripartite-type tricarboxylate transporter receptor subunit TctC
MTHTTLYTKVSSFTKTLTAISLTTLSFFVCPQVWAQDYPTKSIKIIVPFAAGGPADIVTRQVAASMSSVLGQAMVIENVTGAAGIVGTKMGAAAAPDGYTLLLGGTGTHTTNEFLYPSLPYDSDKDFTPIVLMYKAINVFVVPANSPIQTLADLIKQAKQQPGILNYGLGAIGSSSHLSFEKFKKDADIQIVAIPYKGMLPAYTDLMGGRIQVMPNDISNATEQIASGKLRALAVTSAQRFPYLPDIPTVAEQGFPGFEGVGWGGLFAPANTPTNIVTKIAAAATQAYKTDELKQAMRARKVELIESTPELFASFIVQERKKWAKVIQDSKIKLEQ